MKFSYFMKWAAAAFAGAAGAVAARADVAAPPASTIPYERWTLSTGFDYTTGKYGQSSSTDILTIPVIGRYDYDQWTFKLTVPWERISGPADVAPDVGLLRRGAARRSTQTQHGLGDVVGAATYGLLSEKDAIGLDLTGKIKFGTANRNEGLGTGENDYSAQADFYKAVDDLTPFATLGYRILGSPPDVHLNNVWFASLGASYRLSEPLSAGLVWDFQQRPADGVDNISELTAFVTYKLDPKWKVQGYVLTGFSNSSPDFGLGGIVSHVF